MKKVLFYIMHASICAALLFPGCTTDKWVAGTGTGHSGVPYAAQITEGADFMVRSYDIIIDNFYPRPSPNRILSGVRHAIQNKWGVAVNCSEKETPHDARAVLQAWYRSLIENQCPCSPMAVACSMVDAMLRCLDAYSALLTPEAYIKLKKSINRMPCIRYTLVSPGYGYIRIIDFNEHTTHDMQEALQRLPGSKPHVKGLILDLRDNRGGLFEQAIGVADLFLSRGIMLHTQGRNEDNTRIFRAHPETSQGNYPMIVLINAASASGSEIVAGALQDNGRALIMGKRSYGKGVAQTVIPLYNDYALRFSFLGYVRPNGIPIQDQGITPDITIEYDHKPFSLQHSSNDYHVRRALEILKKWDYPDDIGRDSIHMGKGLNRVP